MIEPEQLLRFYNRVKDPTAPALPAAIAAADGLCAQFCGLPLPTDGIPTMGPADYELYPLPRFANPRELDLRLGSLPNIVVDEVHVDELEEFGSDTLVDSGDYVVRGDRLRLKPTASSAWSIVEGANKVTLSAGWSFHNTPDVVHPLMALIAAAAQSIIDRPALQQRLSSTVGGQTVATSDLDDILPAAVRAGLGPYVVWSTRVA